VGFIIESPFLSRLEQRIFDERKDQRLEPKLILHRRLAEASQLPLVGDQVAAAQGVGQQLLAEAAGELPCESPT